jgi:hypothetical protein
VFRAYLAVFTVALTNLLAEVVHKSSHKEKTGGRKTRQCLIENQIPYQTLSILFLISVFFMGNFFKQTTGNQLKHTVSMAGLTDTAIIGPG